MSQQLNAVVVDNCRLISLTDSFTQGLVRYPVYTGLSLKLERELHTHIFNLENTLYVTASTPSIFKVSPAK